MAWAGRVECVRRWKLTGLSLEHMENKSRRLICTIRNVRVTYHWRTFAWCLYLLGYSSGPVTYHSKGTLLYWFEVTGKNKTYLGLYVKRPILLPNFSKIWISHTDFRKFTISNFADICSVNSADMCGQTKGVTWRDGWTDGHDEGNTWFSSLCERAWKYVANLQVQMSKFFSLFKFSIHKSKHRSRNLFMYRSPAILYWTHILSEVHLV